MDLPVRARLGHAPPQWVAEDALFFVTICCAPKALNQLCRAEIGDAIFNSVEFNIDKSIWGCRLMVLMPDHLHAIFTFPKSPGMKTVLTNWKTFIAKNHKIQWQRDFFDRRLRDHHDLVEKWNYIVMNPVRKGLCDRAEDWRWVWTPKR